MAKPSTAEKGGSRVSPEYDTVQYAYAHKKKMSAVKMGVPPTALRSENKIDFKQGSFRS